MAVCALVAGCGGGTSKPGTTSTPSQRSAIRVGIGDQSPALFGAPTFKPLAIKLARYFVTADVMHNAGEMTRVRQWVREARKAGVAPLVTISTADLRPKLGKVVSPAQYRSDMNRFVPILAKLGVGDFGAWNEENNKTQETWDKVADAVAYFKSMWSAVHSRCSSCNVVGLDVLDQAGVDSYIKSFYGRLSPVWRKRLAIVGIHDYSDVNRGRSSGTKLIIDTVRAFNPKAKFWFTETGALASFQGSFPYDEARQAARMPNMFSLARQFEGQGVERVYSYNFFGAGTGGCGRKCPFDAGLTDPNGVPRPVYNVFAAQLAGFSR